MIDAATVGWVLFLALAAFVLVSSLVEPPRFP